jgi:hypothetical protein
VPQSPQNQRPDSAAANASAAAQAFQQALASINQSLIAHNRRFASKLQHVYPCILACLLRNSIDSIA